jgi:IS1 family transposase
MTRVEGENSRLRHYLARLHRKTFCYSCVRKNVVFINKTVDLLLEREKALWDNLS